MVPTKNPGIHWHDIVRNADIGCITNQPPLSSIIKSHHLTFFGHTKTNLDFTKARDSEWHWHQLGHMQVCTSLHTDNHASTPPLGFLLAGCPSYRPTNSIKALKAHTHAHPFNGPLSGTTRVSRYQKGKTNLDFTEARDSDWQWHQLGHMQVCTSLQTDNHTSTPPLSILQAGCPSCRPTNSVKALKASSTLNATKLV